LEADIPQNRRIVQRHQPYGKGQRRDAVRFAPSLCGKQCQTAHDRRAHHRRVAAHEHGVSRYTGNCSQPGAPDAQRRSQQAQHNLHENDQVGTGDGDDVCGASAIEGFLNVGGQFVVNTQQDASQQRRFGAGQQTVECLAGVVAQVKERLHPGATLATGKAFHARIGHNGVNAPAGQVIAVGESVKFRRGEQAARHPKAISEGIVAVARGLGQNAPLRLHSVRLSGQRFDLNGQIDKGLADFWCAGDCAGDCHKAGIRVVADVVRTVRTLVPGMARRSQRKHSGQDEGQP